MIIKEAKFDDIKLEYMQRLDVFDDSPLVIKLINSLPTPERNLMILYSEVLSFEKLSKLMECPKTTLYYNVRDIKNKIIKKMNDYGYTVEDCRNYSTN